MGPVTYAQHLLSAPRLPFTAAYFGSIALTLYFSLGVRIYPSPNSITSPHPTYPPHDGLDHLFTDPHAARISNPHVPCLSLSVGLSIMVSRQLLPHGIERSSTRNHFWSSKGSSMDDRLKTEGVLREVNVMVRGASYTKIDFEPNISNIEPRSFYPANWLQL
jgi:hypothetical protein